MILRLLVLLFSSTIAGMAANYGSLPLAFEPLAGPAPFVSRAPAFNLFVCSDGGVMALAGKQPVALRMRIVNAGGGVVNGEEPLPGRSNYLLGKNPEAWMTGVAQFARVRVRDILPKTDLVYYGTQKTFEYDLVLHAGANPRKLVLRFEGTTSQSIDANGNLLLETEAGQVVQHVPRVVQNQRTVSARYQIESNGDVRVVLGRYDRAQELVVDPVISYSTYLGGSAYDSPNAIAVDAAANAYVAGETSSFQFPTTIGALKTAFPPTFGTVGFVAKVNSTGTALIYSTFVGGSGVNGGDVVSGIAVDSSGNAYITGTTGSADFPVTAQAFSTSLKGGTDAFLAKLNPAGNGLVFSTFFGGSAGDTATALAIDGPGGIYVTGSTGSSDLPTTPGAISRGLKSANDAFVAKFNSTATTLVYGTYLGGSYEDDAYGIAVDATGFAYVVGSTASSDFPVTAGAYMTHLGAQSIGFVAKVNPTGTGLGYATFLGGTSGESISSVAIDGTGAAYVAGTTYSPNFPTSPMAFQATPTGPAQFGHGFAAKVSPTGSSLVYSTYLGGSLGDGVTGLGLDGSGNITLTGFTYSANFPVSSNSLDQTVNYSPAAFVTRINPTGSGLIYSSLLGASGESQGQALALDASNRAYVAGFTTSHSFPVTSGAIQSTSRSVSPLSGTGFVTRVDLGSATTCSLSVSPSSLALASGGTSGSLTVTAASGCYWEAFSSSGWLTINSPTWGIGPGTVNYSSGSNATNLSPRTGTLNVGGLALGVSQAGGSCSSPQFLPASQAFGIAGGAGSLLIAVPSGCAFSGSPSANWITVNAPATGSGSGLISYSVAANSGAPRTGGITFGSSTFTITQSGTAPCVYTVSIPAGLTLPASGGNLTAAIATGAGCSWTASSTASWLSIPTANGTGNGSISLKAAANTSGSLLTTIATIAGQTFAITQLSNAPPTVDSVTPSTGSGTSQTFSFQISDANGYQDLSGIYLIFVPPGASNGTCAFYVDAVNKLLFLFKQDYSTLNGPLVPGNNATVTNGACTASGSSLSMAGSGTHFSINVPVTFSAPFAGMTTINMVAYSQGGFGSGTQSRGTFNVTTLANQPPTVDSVTPSNGTGTSQTFTFQVSDPNGYQNLVGIYLLFNPPSPSNGTCAFYLDAINKLLFVFKQDYSSLLGPLSPGSSSSITNGACSGAGSGYSVAGSGTHLTITVPISFVAPFGGLASIDMVAYSQGGLGSGTQTRGTYNVTTSPGGPPTVDSVSPAGGSGTSQTFTFQSSDPKGYQNMVGEYLIFLPPSAGTCAFYFDNVNKLIYLYKQDYSSLIGPMSAGSSSSLTNGACTLAGGGFTVSGSGTHLTLGLPITFLSPIKGLTNISMVAYSQGGLTSGTRTVGTYNSTTP